MQAVPLISVVIPAYNAEGYIYQCIRSMVRQTLEDIEILVYDDGSVDRTIQEIERCRDERVRIFKGNKNQGVVFARNFLIAKAQGQFIAFQDADDWSDANRLYSQYMFLKSRPHIGCCGTQFVKMVANRPIYYSRFPTDGGSVRDALPEKFHFLPGTIMTRKTVLERTGLYNPYFGNDGNEDTYLTSKIILISGFENIDAHLYYYNLNLTSITKFSDLNARRLYLDEINRVLLSQLINQGTNMLESGDWNGLRSLEEKCRMAHQGLNKFALFESVVGQLVYYKQYGLAIKETMRYLVRNGDFLNSGRLLIYLIRKWSKNES